MRHLPMEVISQIGRWIPDRFCKVLLQTAKVFAGICWCHESHEISINQYYIHQTMGKMHDTIEYIYKIKPRVNNIEITFVEINDPPIWNAQRHKKLDSKNIFIHFELCKVSVIRELIKWFEPGFKCNIVRNNLIEEDELDLYSELDRINKVVTYIHSQSHIDNFMNHPKVLSARELMFGFYSDGNDDICLDLSRVKESENRMVCLSLFQNSDISIRDVHKVTDITWSFSNPMIFMIKGISLNLSNGVNM
jgi:hypothetical protein